MIVFRIQPLEMGVPVCNNQFCCEEDAVLTKVSQSNKLSLDPAYHLPNYVANVFQSYYEENRILGLNFRGHAILPFTMGITMAEN